MLPSAIFLLLVLALGIAVTVVGYLHIGVCVEQPNLPYWLIYYGVLIIILVFARINQKRNV